MLVVQELTSAQLESEELGDCCGAPPAQRTDSPSCRRPTLARTVLVDNNPSSFRHQRLNGIPISNFFEDSGDVELQRLLPVLKALEGVPDVRPVVERLFL